MRLPLDLDDDGQEVSNGIEVPDGVNDAIEIQHDIIVDHDVAEPREADKRINHVGRERWSGEPFCSSAEISDAIGTGV